MTKLVVGKVYADEKEYTGCRECKKKVCTCGKNDMGIIKFMTYSTYVGDQKYSVKGWGAKNIKEGDTIDGEVTYKEYNGKQYPTVTLAKPDPMQKLAELEQRLEDLSSRVQVLEEANFGVNDAPPHTDEDEPDFDVEDLPF